MAKGQMRGNREARKPKKDKTETAPPPAAPGTQVKLAGGTAGFGKKKQPRFVAAARTIMMMRAASPVHQRIPT